MNSAPGLGDICFYCLLLIFAPQSDGQTDPLEAPPWTPGVLAHLVPSCGTHTAQKVESLRYIMARTAIRIDVGDPHSVPAAAPSGRPRLHAPPPASVIVPTPMPTAHGMYPTVYIANWSLADGTPGTNGHISRPTETPLEPPTGSEEQSGRSFPTSTVSLSRLGLAHHPQCAGAGAGSALTCTSEAAGRPP